MAPQRGGLRLPFLYRIFFLVLEPISALAGAYFNHFRQKTYLSLLHASSVPSASPLSAITSSEAVPLSVSVAMSQLANMYAFFAINEAIVLRSTGDMSVWRAVLFVLLLADFGHLWSMKELGLTVYYDLWGWNVGIWGNVPWVYAGATMRICFLLGIGMSKSKGKRA